MVDTRQIRLKFDEYFNYSGRISIDEEGVIDCTGDIVMWTKAKTFPVKFGKTSWFKCDGMGLTSLNGAPETVDGVFSCEGNQLETLQGAPRIIPGWFDCHDNPLKSLQGAPEEVGSNFILDYSPSLPLLRLLATKSKILFSRESRDNYPYAVRIEEILNQFAGQGKRGVPACMVALNNLQKELGIDIRANIKW